MGPTRYVAAAVIAAAGILLAGAASAHPNNVQVIRGGNSSSIVETQEAGVRVLRGTPLLAADIAEAVATETQVQIISAGSRIWLLDRAAGKLSVCRLAATTQVGQRRIDCYARGLPR